MDGVIDIRYDYTSYEPDDIFFEEYDDRKEMADANKKMYIFFQYYNKANKSNNKFFEKLFIDGDQIIANWIIINDCNISSSSRIFNSKDDIKFPNLIGLDLSFNSICDIEAIEHIINKTSSPNLRYLDLSHNPIEFQKDLTEKILKINPKISVINRKRVTPTDFYLLFRNNHDYQKDEYKRCQIHSAVRCLRKDRIYPHVDSASSIIYNNYNLEADYINTFNIKAINLSNCDLVYFDFELFNNAFYIDLSNNPIEKLVFKDEDHPKLLYLDISGTNYHNYEKLKLRFSYCKINPSGDKKTHFQIVHENENHQPLSDYPNTQKLNDIMKFDIECDIDGNGMMSSITKVDIFYYKKYDDRIKFFNEKKSNVIKEYLTEAFSCEYMEKYSICDNVEICLYGYDSNNHLRGDLKYDNFVFYFVSELNLKDVKINQEEFELIYCKCLNVQKLIVEFDKIDKKKTITDTYFADFQKNMMKKLTYFEIILNNYQFMKEKQYNKFIKKISHIINLKYLYVSGYTNDLSEPDEIDTTFKFIRGLDTFNGYRNFIPPTPAQYLALKKIDQSKNSNNYYINMNNMSLLLFYKDDLNNDYSKKEIFYWSKILPIRDIIIKKNNTNRNDVNDDDNSISNIEETQEIVIQNSELFDKYPRLKTVNGNYIKKDIKKMNIKDSGTENELFGSFTSKTASIIEKFSQIQFFLVYSFRASSSFTSKLLYFFFTLWSKIERFMLMNNIFITNDFISVYEKLFFFSFAPFLVLKLLFWEPSYASFVSMAKNKKATFSKFFATIFVVAIILTFCGYMDSCFVSKDIVYFPYLLQFAIFLFFMLLSFIFYSKYIFIRTEVPHGSENTPQELNTFQAFLEFKYLKSKVAFSLLMILVMPVCNIVLDTYPAFTFYYSYKFLFAIIIIFSISFILLTKTISQWSNIIHYLGLDITDKEAKKKTKLKTITSSSSFETLNNTNEDLQGLDDIIINLADENEEDDDSNKTHYIILSSSDVKATNEKSCLSILYRGACKYKITNEDNIYNKFASEYRSPTQIFYSPYRYRPLQNLYGFVDLLQRILTVVISKFAPRYLFVVSTLMLIYAAIWWPHYNIANNISSLLSSSGNTLMTLSNFVLYYFGFEDNEIMKSLVSYIDIFGMVMSFVALPFPFLYDKIIIKKK